MDSDIKTDEAALERVAPMLANAGVNPVEWPMRLSQALEVLTKFDYVVDREFVRARIDAGIIEADMDGGEFALQPLQLWHLARLLEHYECWAPCSGFHDFKKSQTRRRMEYEQSRGLTDAVDELRSIPMPHLKATFIVADTREGRAEIWDMVYQKLKLEFTDGHNPEA